MPKEIKEMQQKERKAFLTAVKESSTVPRRFVRIMIVGKSKAGKTTLLKRLLEKDIDFSTGHESTDGINIEIWKCQIDLQTEKWTCFQEENYTREEILKSNPEIANCGFWDFAGQKEYYATHQTFLTSNALYLLVVDASEKFEDITVEKQTGCDFKTTGDYIDFWFDKIHCYAVEEHLLDTKELNPPILLVGTRIDKITECSLDEKRANFNKHLDKFVCQKQTRKHIIGNKIYLISNVNLNMEGSQFEEIKNQIMTFAHNTEPLNLPVEWILLEKVLAMRNDEVISYAELEQLAKEKHVQIELNLFLQYEHDIGNIIFFQDINECIILDQQWLIDAFKCVVASPDNIILPETKYCTYSKEMIEHLLCIKCSDRNFKDKSSFLIKIFEKFDIIVTPYIEEVQIEYYIPCLMGANLTEDIWNNFGGKYKDYEATSWLYMELEFLPPALFNHILAFFVRKYKICTYKDTPALFKKMGMFYLDAGGLYKLALSASLDTIALQILEMTKHKYSYCKLREHLVSIVHKLFKRYRMRLSYKLKLGCSNGPYYSKTGRIDLPEMKKANESKLGKYFCEEDQTTHMTKNIYSSWFGKTLPIPTFSNYLTENDEQIHHTCEFCSCQRVLCCENCQQDMCCECFDKHQSLDTERSHSGVIYDKFVLEGTFDVGASSITDMVVLPNGLLVLVIFSGYLLTYDIDGGNHKRIPVDDTSYFRSFLSLTVVDNNTVALLTNEGVFIVDVRRKHTIRKVTLKSVCLGLMFIDDMLYVGGANANSPIIQVLDIVELKVQKTIQLSYGPRCLRYGNNGRIYCLTVTRGIVIYDMDLNELFTLEDLNIPRRLTNITIDNDGNALVLSHDFDGSLIKITPNGKTFPVLSFKNNMEVKHVKHDNCLCFQAENRKLFRGYFKVIEIYTLQNDKK